MRKLVILDKGVSAKGNAWIRVGVENSLGMYTSTLVSLISDNFVNAIGDSVEISNADYNDLVASNQRNKK